MKFSQYINNLISQRS